MIIILGDGADVFVSAGTTSAAGKQGGFVQINGGNGAFKSPGFDGGMGGDVFINGGEAFGQARKDRGGDIALR